MKFTSRKIAIAGTIAAAVVGMAALIVLAVMSLQPSETLPGGFAGRPTTGTSSTSGSTSTTPTSSTGSTTTATNSTVASPIYLSIVTHIEEPGGDKPDYLADENLFDEQRASYVELSNMLHEKGIPFDFQSDWNFLEAVAKFDHGDSSTNGKNLVKWMHDDLGFIIDPHAHQTKYNYADVAYLIKQLGVEPTTIAGGFIAYPFEDSNLETLRDPIHGAVYDYTWQADVIWGGGTSGHTQDDVVKATGVWRPLDTEHYYTDDPNGSLIDIGAIGGWNNVAALVKLQKEGKLPAGMYTVHVMCEPSDMLEDDFLSNTEKMIDSYSADVKAGRVIFADLPTVESDWKTIFKSEASVMSYADFIDLSGMTPPTTKFNR